MIATLKSEEQRLHLFDISWETYVSFTDGLGERRIRVTYDRGEMEVMTVSREHEFDKKLLARLIEAMTEELEIDIATGGNMTARRHSLLRALEPDECYWIQNERALRMKKPLDLEVDPPPDLAVEVEVSRSAMDRMAIYAALKVPEVWCWDGETLTVHALTTRGSYRKSSASKAFPFLPLDQFVTYLMPTQLSQTQLIRQFRAWVRKNKRIWMAA